MERTGHHSRLPPSRPLNGPLQSSHWFGLRQGGETDAVCGVNDLGLRNGGGSSVITTGSMEPGGGDHACDGSDHIEDTLEVLVVLEREDPGELSSWEHFLQGGDNGTELDRVVGPVDDDRLATPLAMLEAAGRV
jgi:hypothetical protein